MITKVNGKWYRLECNTSDVNKEERRSLFRQKILEVKRDKDVNNVYCLYYKGIYIGCWLEQSEFQAREIITTAYRMHKAVTRILAERTIRDDHEEFEVR